MREVFMFGETIGELYRRIEEEKMKVKDAQQKVEAKADEQAEKADFKANKVAGARRVIQIVISADSEILYALCDDGTVWKYFESNNHWLSRPIPLIPSENI